MISLSLPTGVFSFSLNSSNEYKISGSLDLKKLIAEIPSESDSNYKRTTPTYYYSIYLNKNNNETYKLWSATEANLTNDTISFEEKNIQSLLNDGIKQTIYINIDVKTQFTHIYFTSNTISFLAINKKPTKTIKEKSGSTIGLVFNNLSKDDESALSEARFPSFNTSSERFVIPLKYYPADRKIIARYFFNSDGNYNNKRYYYNSRTLAVGKETWNYKYYYQISVAELRYYTRYKSDWDNLTTPARIADRYYTDANGLRHYVYYENYGTEQGKIYQYHSVKEIDPVQTWSTITTTGAPINLQDDYYLNTAQVRPGVNAIKFASDITYYVGYRTDEVTSWNATNSNSITRSTGRYYSDALEYRYEIVAYYDGWRVKIWKDFEGTAIVGGCGEQNISGYSYTYRYVDVMFNRRVYEGRRQIEEDRWYFFADVVASYRINLYVPEVTGLSTYEEKEFGRQFRRSGYDNSYRELTLSNGVKLDVRNYDIITDGITYTPEPIHRAMRDGGLRMSATPNKYIYSYVSSIYVKSPIYTHTYTNTNVIGAEVNYREKETDSWIRYESVNTWYTENNQIKYTRTTLPEIDRTPKLI